jgi:hypothetical protein
MSGELHSAALELARLGCAVFPCQPRGKTPASQHGCKDATTDPVRIDSWWNAYPDLNIGIATGAVSGFFVVDVDGEKGEASLRKLEEAHEPLPPTVEAITGKGRHCYFRHGEHGSVGNSVGLIGSGIDIRGDGGYVLAPPSIHPSGRAYTWSVDGAEEYADAPDWLHALIGNDISGTGKPLEHWHSVLTGEICNGKRNTTLASIAGKLFFHDVNAVLVHDILGCVNEVRCETPLAQHEVETIVVSVGKAHLQGVRP